MSKFDDSLDEEDEEELDEDIKEFMASVAKVIEETRVPYARVEVDGFDKPVRPTASKIGGVPYLPVDDTQIDFEKFIFVAQINFAELKLPPFPSRGIVQFWVGRDDAYGLFAEDPSAKFRCIYFSDIGKAQRRDVKLHTEGGPVMPETAEKGNRLSFKVGSCVVAPEDCRWEPFLERHQLNDGGTPDAAYKRYSAAGHRIGGYCAFTQGDPRDPADPQMSLLQLDSDDHLFWGDSGIAHWFIREEDLLRCDFSKVEYTWDCC